MRLLVLGGSFNPVHLGHLAMAEDVRAQFGYDQVILVPSLNPPHKDFSADPGPAHRLAMLGLALAGSRGLLLDDCEIRRGGTSWTIDTLRDLSRRYPLEGRLGLILGDDLIPGFPSWRDPDALAREADLVCAHRATADRLPLAWPHRYADNLPLPLSSSLIRERLAKGLPARYLLPPGVYDYILAQGLYGSR